MQRMDVLGLLRAFRHAGSGIWEALRTQQSFQIQSFAALVVLAVLFVLPLSVSLRALLIFIIAVVLAFELLNTALERLANVVQPQKDPRVRQVKDFGAGAVLLTAIGAAVAGALVVLTYI